VHRILIVFNKWWEFEPGFASLLSDYARPPELSGWWPNFHDHPRPRRDPAVPGAPRPAFPRAVFKHPWGQVEVWCISDLLEHLPDEGKWQSSSERKAERLSEMFRGEAPRLVIAVGTASAGDSETLNGSVVVGTTCFLHNSRPNGTNSYSNWQEGPFHQIIDSSLSTEEFARLVGSDDPTRREAENRFLPAPLHGASKPSIHANYDAVALGNMNVTNYEDYQATDQETIDAFRQSCPGAVFGSLETTHGLIRAMGGPRFLFISGIVDRLGRFDEDVAPKPYAQNSAGAHNAGLALAWMLPRIEGGARVAHRGTAQSRSSEELPESGVYQVIGEWLGFSPDR
jgi:hypothetical protein